MNMDWKNLLGSLSESVNDELRLRMAYLTAENRMLRQQISGRVHLSDSDRKELGEIGRQLGRKALSEIATVAQPDTIVAWGRKFAEKPVDTAKPRKSVGRLRVDQEIEDWVVRMARENRSWGYDRIQGALKHLGYTISDQTVGNILKRHGISPAPERKKTVTWREFVQSHWNVFVATGFFSHEVWSWYGRMSSFLLFLLHFCHHRVHSVSIGLQHPIQGMRSFVSWSRNIIIHAHYGRHGVKQRIPAPQYGDAVPEFPVPQLIICDEGRHPCQDRGKVVVLLAVYPRPIRDGPIRRGQRFNVLVQTDSREAA